MGNVKVNNTQGQGNKCRGVTNFIDCFTYKHAICTWLLERVIKGIGRNSRNRRFTQRPLQHSFPLTSLCFILFKLITLLPLSL